MFDTAVMILSDWRVTGHSSYSYLLDLHVNIICNSSEIFLVKVGQKLIQRFVENIVVLAKLILQSNVSNLKLIHCGNLSFFAPTCEYEYNFLSADSAPDISLLSFSQL